VIPPRLSYYDNREGMLRRLGSYASFVRARDRCDCTPGQKGGDPPGHAGLIPVVVADQHTGIPGRGGQAAPREEWLALAQLNLLEG